MQCRYADETLSNYCIIFHNTNDQVSARSDKFVITQRYIDVVRCSLFMKMENLRFRAVIQFLTLEGKKPQEIFDRMGNVYGTSAPCYTTVKKWAAEFKRGRQSLEDDPRAGRPVEVTTHEMCEAVERVVLENRRVKVTEIAERTNISVGSVETIIHEHLGMRKVSARWVPRLLTPDMKHRRVECCQELLTRFENNFEDFKQRIVTGDETWLHCWDPDTKQESMQWKHVGSPPPRKARTQASAGKVMATIFWDTQGVILIDYLPQGSTITGTYYKNVLNQLRDALKQKRRGKLSRGILLLHDNAPSHSSRIAQAALDECNVDLNNCATRPTHLILAQATSSFFVC